MRNIAIIPARGGSKRIPRKNIKPFFGKPIIAYSIVAAIESNLFDEIMVSTDDNEIAEIAMQYGAKVPFYRSKKNSDDYATTVDVIEEVLLFYEQKNDVFDNFCCLYPTAPLISKNRIIEGYSLLKKSDFHSVFPVLQYSYPIQRSLKMEGDKIVMVWPENYSKRSQDLIPTYHDSGQFYWMKTASFKLKRNLFTDNSGAIFLSEFEVQDIDREEDWEVAELKFKHLKSKGKH